MKKLLAIVLSVAMIACFAVVASAEETVSATVSTVSAKAGDAIVLDVTLSKVAYGYAAVTVDVDTTCYNAEELEFTGFKKAKGFSGIGDFSAVVDGAAKYGFVTTDGGEDYPGNQEGVIVQLKFNVLKDVEKSEVGVLFTAKTYDDANIVNNSAANASVVKGGVENGVEPPEDSSIIDPPVEDSSIVDPPVEDSSIVAPGESKVESEVESKVESKVDTDSTVAVVTGGTTTGSTTNPKNGDASAVAVAGVLCAAMAAAFVITKKSK